VSVALTPPGAGFGWVATVECATEDEAAAVAFVAGHGGAWRDAFRGMVATRWHERATVCVEWWPCPAEAVEADAQAVVDLVMAAAEEWQRPTRPHSKG
jgi:enamine deaminase RidA (YjgF/YER057c/UK114 family)